MDDLPADLLALIPDDGRPAAERWWAALGEADRRTVAGLWDERWEVCFFAPQPTDDWEQVPAVAGGRFVPSDDDGRREWLPGYFEYLLQNPELVMAHDPTNRRTFHICTRHPAARACLAAGAVPAGFACPVGDAECPLRPLRGSRLTRRKADEVL